MKKLFSILTFCFLVSFYTSLRAQSFSCADFSIVSFSQDTLVPSIYQVGINFNGPANEFINYPYIAAILDCNNDTAAIGNMNWFGQFGQTMLEYPVTLNTGTACQPQTAVFVYLGTSGNIDTCFIPMISTATHSFSSLPVQTSLYPNPAVESLQITTSVKNAGLPYQICDLKGQLIQTGIVQGNKFTLSCNFAPGMYIFRVIESKEKPIRFVVK